MGSGRWVQKKSDSAEEKGPERAFKEPVYTIRMLLQIPSEHPPNDGQVRQQGLNSPPFLPYISQRCQYRPGYTRLFSIPPLTQRIFLIFEKGKEEKGKKSKNYSTQYSRVVSHRSTDCAITSLTSEIGRDPVLSGVYGRSCKSSFLQEYILYFSSISIIRPKQNQVQNENKTKSEPGLEPKQNQNRTKFRTKTKPSLEPKQNQNRTKFRTKTKPSLEPKQNQNRTKIRTESKPNQNQDQNQIKTKTKPGLEPNQNQNKTKSEPRLEPNQNQTKSRIRTKTKPNQNQIKTKFRTKSKPSLEPN